MIDKQLDMVSNGIDSIDISCRVGEDSVENSKDKPIDDIAEEWGFPLPELYKLAVKFYKGEY